MYTFTLNADRLWILRTFGRSPLVRMSDRVEAVILVLAVVTALVVTPVAGAIGTAVYEMRARNYAQEAQTRHTVLATAIEDSTQTAGRYDEEIRVRVRWWLDGVEHAGSVDVARETKAGNQVNVWVDGTGSQVAEPIHPSRAGVDAVSAAAAVWLSAMASIAAVCAFVRYWLNRRRYAAWDSDWAVLINGSGGRTGSQT